MVRVIFGTVVAILLAAEAVQARAHVRSIAGTARVMPAGATVAKSLAAGVALAVGDRVITGHEGRVELLLADGSRVRIEPSTIVRIDGSGAATTAISIPKGLASISSSGHRWRSEALQVSTPVATAGVRGTEFQVGVSESGEAYYEVISGEVVLPDTVVTAGSAAEVGYTDEKTVMSRGAAPGTFEAWRVGRDVSLEENTHKAAATLGALLKDAIGRRLRIVGEVIAGWREVAAAISLPETGDRRERFIAKALRLVESVRRAAESVRGLLASDREATLQEEKLREIFEGRGLPAGARIAAKWALDFAEKDRRRRESDLAAVDRTIRDLGAALVHLAALAASDPARDRGSARIIEDGLGVPLRISELTGPAPVLTIDDLCWRPGAEWRMLRTIRGRDDLRVAVTMRIEERARGKMGIIRTPDAFDTSAWLEVRRDGDSFHLEGIHIEGTSAKKRSHSMLLYAFPISLGSHWTAWDKDPGNPKSLKVIREVVAAERVTVPAGEFDCLKIETRLRGPNNRPNLLLTSEWLAPGIGQIREMTFRGERKSLEWNERLGD